MVWLHPQTRQATNEEIAKYHENCYQRTRFSFDESMVDFTINGIWTAVSTKTSQYRYADGMVSKWGGAPITVDDTFDGDTGWRDQC